MKIIASTLYLLFFSASGLWAQTYGTPPPLLPNPAHGTYQPINDQVVYAPESYTNANPAARIHVVKKGENLYKIAQLYKVTVDDIKAWNYLPSDLIAAGAKLSIGAPTSSPPPAANALPASYSDMTERAVPGWLTNRQSHTLLAGESLASIAQYYGFTEARLRSMNGFGPQDLIPVGFALNLNPCNTTGGNMGNDLPAPYGQPNTGGNPSGVVQNYNSAVPAYFPPYDRFANSASNANNSPSSYNYTGTNQGVYRREDQYDPYGNASNAVPNSYYEYGNTGVPNSNPSGTSTGNLIYENGRRVYIVGISDTLETIADQYQIPAERLRFLNNMGTYDIVRANQRLLLE